MIVQYFLETYMYLNGNSADMCQIMKEETIDIYNGKTGQIFAARNIPLTCYIRQLDFRAKLVIPARAILLSLSIYTQIMICRLSR